ncbi:hypothetical protein, partial [Desulfuromonas sp.]
MRRLWILNCLLLLILPAFSVSAQAERTVRVGVYQYLPMLAPGADGQSLWLPNTLKVLAVLTILFSVTTLLARHKTRKGLREIAAQNRQLEEQIAERSRA